MNILPLVFTFLTVFSLIALTFVREVKSSRIAEKAVESRNALAKKINNHGTRKLYHSDTKKGHGEGAPRNVQHIASKRDQFPPLENSKFNLGVLTQQEGEIKLHPLYELSAALLRNYYGEKIFKRYGEKMEFRMLEAIIAKARKTPDVQNMADLTPDDPALAKAFYEMLKGTNMNSVPPFADVFVFTKEKHAFSFPFASSEILQTVFGKEITQNILAEEEKKSLTMSKFTPISKENLTSLLNNKPVLSSKYSPIEPYIDFAIKKTVRKEVGGRDRQTGLTLRTRKKMSQ